MAGSGKNSSPRIANTHKPVGPSSRFIERTAHARRSCSQASTAARRANGNTSDCSPSFSPTMGKADEKPSTDMSVAELVERFMRDDVEKYYRREDGVPSG